MVIDFVDFTHSRVNQLMPGGNNRSEALSKPANFTYMFLFKHL